MNAILLAALGLGAFALGYRFYARFIGDRIFQLDPKFETPAHALEDGVDFVPTNKWVLWGHHFTSVAGAAPIVGPAIAVIWGWLPAFLWVTLGTIFFAGVHDAGALWASIRNEGKSIGALTESVVGPRARSLFMVVIFLLLLMVNAVFAIVIAGLFQDFPSSVIPSWFVIAVAMGIGWALYRRGVPLLWPSVIGLILLYSSMFVGNEIPIMMPDAFGLEGAAIWVLVLFGYAFFASSLPVWLLLQPRDYINGLQLFIALAVFYGAVILGNPTIVAPAFNTAIPDGAPPFIPLLFVTIACGAISGFHGSRLLGDHLEAAQHGDGRPLRRILGGRRRGQPRDRRDPRHDGGVCHARGVGRLLHRVCSAGRLRLRLRGREHHLERPRIPRGVLTDLPRGHGRPLRRYHDGHGRTPAALHRPGVGKHLQHPGPA